MGCVLGQGMVLHVKLVSCTPAAISGRAMSGRGIDLDKARYLHVILAPSHGRDLYLTRRLRTAPTGPRPRRRNLLAPPAGALSTNVGFPVTTRGGDPRGLTGSGFTIGDNTKVIPEQKACAHHGITKLLTSRPHRPPECRFGGIEHVACYHRLVRIGRRPVGVCQCSGCHGAIVRNMEPQACLQRPPPDISSNYSDMCMQEPNNMELTCLSTAAAHRRVQKRSGRHGGVGHNIESPRTVHGTPTPGRDSRFNGWHGDESNVDSQACPPQTLPRPLQSLAQGEARRHNLHGCAGGCFLTPLGPPPTLSTVTIHHRRPTIPRVFTIFTIHVIYHHVTVHHRKTNYPAKKPA